MYMYMYVPCCNLLGYSQTQTFQSRLLQLLNVHSMPNISYGTGFEAEVIRLNLSEPQINSKSVARMLYMYIRVCVCTCTCMLFPLMRGRPPPPFYLQIARTYTGTHVRTERCRGDDITPDYTHA